LSHLTTTYDINQVSKPKNIKTAVAKEKRQICNHLVTADHDGQKNRNGVLFSNVFY